MLSTFKGRPPPRKVSRLEVMKSFTGRTEMQVLCFLFVSLSWTLLLAAQSLAFANSNENDVLAGVKKHEVCLERDYDRKLCSVELRETVLTMCSERKTRVDVDCGTAVLQGRRANQEDRVLCVPRIVLPALGSAVEHTNVVGLFGVFDGHGGFEASELASKYLPCRFLYHASSRIGRIFTDLNPIDSSLVESRQPEVDSIGSQGGHNHFESEDSEVQAQIASPENQGEFTAGDHSSASPFHRNYCCGNALERSLLECCEDEILHSHGIVDGKLPSFLDDELSLEVIEEAFPDEQQVAMQWMASTLSSSTYRSILKKSLRRAILDIDSAFSIESTKRGLRAGSTAAIVLVADGQFLVANVGDSKALICRSCTAPDDNFAGENGIDLKPFWVGKKDRDKETHVIEDRFGMTPLCVKELTVDHHPDRQEERARIEAVGGFVSKWGGVLRVNGQLAVTRAIGDVYFKKYGVISEPEFTDWQEIGHNDSFLILASDGVFEGMSTQDVCNIMQDRLEVINTTYPSENGFTELNSQAQDLAQAVVDRAYEIGSMDNLAAVVLPFGTFFSKQLSPLCSMGFSSKVDMEPDSSLQTENELLQSGFHGALGDFHRVHEGQTIQHENEKASSNVVWANEEFTPASGRLLKGKEVPGCYRLTQRIRGEVLLPLQSLVGKKLVDAMKVPKNPTEVEGLSGSKADIAVSHDDVIPMGSIRQLSPLGIHDDVMPMGSIWQSSSLDDGQLELYHEHHICLPRSLQADEKDFCLNPDGFTYYIGLIGAVPLDNQTMQLLDWDKAGTCNQDMFYPYSLIHQRYMLTKNVARGGFGEIWLGVLHNCSPGNDESWESWKEISRFRGSSSLQNFKVNGEQNATSNSSNTWTRNHFWGCTQDKQIFVLKRILVEKGGTVYLSGMREKYFGEVFLNARNLRKEKKAENYRKKPYEETDDEEAAEDVLLKHIVRYVESFEANKQEEFWLVFHNEGHSLSSLLYSAEGKEDKDGESMAGQVQVLQPSKWWRWLKTTEAGQQEMRSLIYQLLMAVKACHDRNITHRDIKPENMIVRATNKCLFTTKDHLHTDWPCNLTMRIIDFGSAINPYTLQQLYGRTGPSRAEQTAEYTPPEAFLQRNWLKFHGNLASMYDMWSIGVVMLELVLGTPHVFQISAKTQAMLEQRLKGWDGAALDTAYILRALLEMCILFPGQSAHHQQYKPLEGLDTTNLVSWKCTEEALMQQIKQRDPLGLGVPDIWALRLLRSLLQWYPEDRITAAEALQHPYFHPSLQG